MPKSEFRMTKESRKPKAESLVTDKAILDDSGFGLSEFVIYHSDF